MLNKQKKSNTFQLMQNLTNTVSLGFVLIFVACGAKDQSVPGAVELIRGMSGADADMISEQRVNCYGMGEVCPSAIAKIVPIIPGSDKHCTGFLVNDQTLITAASCLPDELRKSPGADCSNRIFILFPESKNHPAQRVDCESVEYASPLDDAHPAFIKQNWAKIKLAHAVTREPLVISTNEGIARAKDKKYTSWRVSTETDSGNTSIIKKYECDVIEETYGNPMAKGRFFPNPTIGSCYYYTPSGVREEEKKQFRGNLGAPILSASGKVVGIIGEDLMNKEEYEKLAKDNFIHFKTQTQNYEDLKIMKFATNLACLSEFAGLPLPAQCTDLYTEEEFKTKREELLKSETTDGMAQAEEYIRTTNRLDNGKKLQWDLGFKPIQDQRREVFYSPKCYEAPEVWLPTEDSLYVKLLTFKLWLKQEADMSVSFNNLGILIRLNGFLKPEARYEIRKDKAVQLVLTVKPTKIKDKKVSEITVNGGESPETKPIDICKPE